MTGGTSDYYDVITEEGRLFIRYSEKESQEIKWKQNFSNLEFGDIIELNATATGLPVNYRVMVGANVVEWLDPGVLRIIGAGTIQIEASQDGDATRNAAEPVVVHFEIPKLEQEIFWDQDFGVPSYGDVLTLTAASNSGLPIHYTVIQGQADYTAIFLPQRCWSGYPRG